MSTAGADRDADGALAAAATALYDAVAARLAGYVHDRVVGLAAGWAPGNEVEAATAASGTAAAAHVLARLADLLAADVDGQATTPLEVVRGIVPHATEVLDRLGVPAVARDPFKEHRFPEDRYDLVPASLGALGHDVGEAAVVWGAAKAMAHRRRHQPASPPE